MAEVAGILVECGCAECRSADRLPAYLQGIPGARQLTFIARKGQAAVKDPVRAACSERCAQFGDPPCYELEGTGPVDDPFIWTPCSECLADAGEIAPAVLDPNAAIRNLI
jgi:hypothetical protein